MDQAIERYRLLFERSPVCIHELDSQGRLLSINRAGLALIGVNNEEDVRGRPYLDFVSAEDKERIRQLLTAACTGSASKFEFSSEGPASPRYFSSCFVPCPDAGGSIQRILGISSDITEHRAREAELQRLNHTRTVLSRCKDILARAVDEPDLLTGFCKAAVEVGHYRLAWVGYRKAPRESAVRLMASAGCQDGEVLLSGAGAAD